MRLAHIAPRRKPFIATLVSQVLELYSRWHCAARCAKGSACAAQLAERTLKLGTQRSDALTRTSLA